MAACVWLGKRYAPGREWTYAGRKLMQAWRWNGWLLGLALLGTPILPALGGPFQLISTLDPAQGSPSGGNGDSFATHLSADGRYVLFASAANNLVLNSSNHPIPTLFPAALNAF